MTELKQIADFITTKLNAIITALNNKVSVNGTVQNALNLEDKTLAQVIVNANTSIRAGVPLAGDDLNKLYQMIVALDTLLTSNDVNLDELQEVVDFIKANKSSLDSLSISNIAGLTTALAAKADSATLSKFGNDFKFQKNTLLNSLAGAVPVSVFIFNQTLIGGNYVWKYNAQITSDNKNTSTVLELYLDGNKVQEFRKEPKDITDILTVETFDFVNMSAGTHVFEVFLSASGNGNVTVNNQKFRTHLTN